MLTAYQLQTTALLQNPSAPSSLYATADINRWINIARGQVAGESEGICAIGTVLALAGQRVFNFSDINVGDPATTGIGPVIHVRAIQYGVGEGQQFITPRPWEWMQLYGLNNPIPRIGAPEMWAQFAQGAAFTVTGTGTIKGGSFYIDPIPDIAYTFYCDCVCGPIPLVDDGTVESLPYLWTDAVPFFAAYYALLSSQTGARQADAARMFEAYSTFMDRARKAANPSVNRWMYRQAPDPTMISKLGLQQKAG